MTASFADLADKVSSRLPQLMAEILSYRHLLPLLPRTQQRFRWREPSESAGTTAATRSEISSLTSTKGSIAIAETTTSELYRSGISASSLDSVDNVDLATSAATASASLSVLDAAIAQVSAGRADLGAIQNRFESVISSLQVASENAEASRSRIQDADFRF